MVIVTLIIVLYRDLTYDTYCFPHYQSALIIKNLSEIEVLILLFRDHELGTSRESPPFSSFLLFLM